MKWMWARTGWGGGGGIAPHSKLGTFVQLVARRFSDKENQKHFLKTILKLLFRHYSLPLHFMLLAPTYTITLLLFQFFRDHTQQKSECFWANVLLIRNDCWRFLRLACVLESMDQYTENISPSPSHMLRHKQYLYFSDIHGNSVIRICCLLM